MTAGLKYWGRAVRRHDRANDYLGSLFAEGGLPWSLISSPTHGFGRAVKSGVRHYYLDKESGRSVVARMAGFHNYFPRSFKTEEVSLLLAGIVTQLISIVETFQFRGSEHPVLRLDRELPGWRDGFPIPLDDGNAVQLVSEWLVDADRERQAWQVRQLQDQPSTCKHRLSDGDPSLGRIRTYIEIQREIQFPVPGAGLSNTRLEMVCYEGDRPVQGVGSVYAVVEEGTVRLRSPKSSIELSRASSEHQLTLRLLDSGVCVYSIALADSAIEAEHAPVIFERDEEAWWYLSTATCTTRSDRLLVRLPSSWILAEGEAAIISSSELASWFEASADIVLSGEGERVIASFADKERSSWRLSGSTTPVASRPDLTFFGWPRLAQGRESTKATTGHLHSINGRRRLRLDAGAEYGCVRYQLCDSEDGTLFRQRFGLLPTDFRVRLTPRTGSAPAKLTINTMEHLLVSVTVGTGEANAWEHAGESMLELPDLDHHGQDDIRLSVHARSNPNPVALHYPFPFEGVRVTNLSGDLVSGRTMTLDELLGMEAVLFAGPTGVKTFRVVLSLVGERGSAPSQYATVRVVDQPVRIRLYSFADEVAALLGVSDNQDSVVRFSIESGIEHIAFRIGHYKFWAMPASGGTSVIISTADAVTQESDATPAAMCIPELGIAPIRLQGDPSGPSGGATFAVPEQVELDGPWLIHALPESSIRFRPLFVLGRPRDSDTLADDALGVAIRGFHPKLRPNLISNEIAKMGGDPAHQGWTYLKKLKDEYAHLPLSAFEVWKAIACDSRCLALSVLRMELSIEFCHRVQIELAVVWEAIPIHHWRDALAACSGWFESLGFPDALVQQFRADGVRKIKGLWPGFEHLGTYLEGGPLPPSPPLQLVLPTWYQALRTQHAEDERWPTQCGLELRSWVADRDLPPEIKGLATLDYTNAVTYLPIFLAHVTTGRAPLELSGISLPVLKHAIRHVASFDHAHWFSPVHGLVTCHLARSQN